MVANKLLYSFNGLFILLTVINSEIINKLVINSLENTLTLVSNTINTADDVNLNFTEFAEKYGYNSEERRVITDDGYILTVFHIPGNTKKPVLLVHGLLDSADTYIIRGNLSLAIKLSDEGYDVWATNARGNRYSRKHVTLDPDTDKEFWNFTFNEQAYYDLPAVIDYVLSETNQNSLSVIGHSQGTQVFFALGSLRPEYNDKIKILIALAPVCFLSYNPPPVSELIKAAPAVSLVAKTLGIEEFFRNNSVARDLIELFCTQGLLSFEICNVGVIGAFAGPDPEELLPIEFSDVIYSHFPSSTSRKNLDHTAQIGNRGKFAQYDYDLEGNLKAYKQVEPPEYDLKDVTMNVALLAGRRDRLADLQDVENLKAALPNVVNYTIIPREECNHLDFVWGLHMNDYLFPFILELLAEF